MANILIADDIKENVTLLKLILDRLGHRTVESFSGAQTLELIERESVDLALIDIDMPDMSGNEVVSRMKSDERARHIPVILLTPGEATINELVKGLESGAEEYISKPFIAPELVARVRSMLRSKKLYDDLVESKTALERELLMAQSAQAAMLPERFPYPDRVELRARYKPTSMIGGDYYDAIDYGSNRLGIILADVSGHGPSAAMSVSILKVAAINSILHGADPVKVANHFNRQFLAVTPTDQYVTMFFGLIDLEAKSLEYIRAGHPYPLLLKAKTRETISLEAKGSLLGIFDPIEIARGSVKLERGDRILAYSDGIIDVMGAGEELYGAERLKRFVTENFDKEPDDLLDGILARIESFSARGDFDDDIAILLTKIL